MDKRRIGKFIANLRKQKGLSQVKLGEKLGVDYRTISRWENGFIPKMEMFQLLSEEFNISIDELILGGNDDEAKRRNCSL